MRIIAFQSLAQGFLGSLGLNEDEAEIVDEDWSDDETDNYSPDEIFDLTQENVRYLSVGQVENMALFLPSTFGIKHCLESNLHKAVQKEIKLREGQANDSLQQLRLSIGQKSFLFRSQLRNAKSKTRKTKAWDDISSVGNTVSHHRRVYHSARDALIALGAGKEIIKRYQVITSKDVRSSTAIVDPNARGQRNKGLAWFWSSGSRKSGKGDGALMTECKWSDAYPYICNDARRAPLVYRVHWLRARARYERWREEMDLTSHEMLWTVNFFDFKSRQWKEWADTAYNNDRPGHYYYANRQYSLWLSMADHAVQAFQHAILAAGGDPTRIQTQRYGARRVNPGSDSGDGSHDSEAGPGEDSENDDVGNGNTDSDGQEAGPGESAGSESGTDSDN